MAGACLAALAVSLAPAAAQTEPSEPPLKPPSVQAASAILVDAATGTVLFEKDARTRRPMASTTKIMTATMILESGRLGEAVTFSEKARHTPYANFNAAPGESVPMQDLLYAIMLRSSNDGCVAAAEHLSGSAAAFAQQMTSRARELGAADTNFVTTNGLYAKEHYSTAYDLALMTRHAIQYPLFNQVVATKSYKLNRSKNTKDLVVTNHNKFLGKYQGADGVKTGYVRQSGRCLVASATHQEAGHPWRLIAVVLNSGDTYGDSTALMEWGKQNFQPVFFAKAGETVALASVDGGSRESVPLVPERDLTAVIRRIPGKNIERSIQLASEMRAPVTQRQVGGKLVGLVDGRPVAEVPLVATGAVGRVWLAGMAPWTGWTLVLAAVALGPRYARSIASRAARRAAGSSPGASGTAAKSTRRRRRGVAARRRTADYDWESYS
ncbi:MAG: D-alanyl-D-alanine carboxypeptidase family protein [Armatimonadota bacterium]